MFSRPDHPLEIVQVELPAGQRVVLPASSYAHIRQAVWVQSGELVIVEGGERHLLGAGDCLGFGPPSEVTFANETAAPASMSSSWPGASRMPEIEITPLSASPQIRRR